MARRKIYLISALVLVITAIFSAGYLHPDEHFQIIEFAGLKLHLTEKMNLPWEFHQQMRPAIQPFMVVVIFRFFSLFGTPDPFFVAFILRLLTALVSFLGMWSIYKVNEKEIGHDLLKKWFLFLSFFLWFVLFINVRFTSETWSGSVFLIAFAFLQHKQPRTRLRDYFLTGILLGLSFLFRYQSGILVLGMGLWLLLVRKAAIYRMLMLFSGIILVFFTGLMLDRWFYGEWTVTAWNYLQQNIIFDKVSGFGIQPWWFYIRSTFYEGIPPFSLVYIAAVLLFLTFKRKDILTWTLFPFLTIHFLIGHKEMRFLFPILGFLPLIIIQSTDLVRQKWVPGLLEFKAIKYLAKIFWGANLVMLLAIAVSPVDNEIRIFQTIYRNYPAPTTLYFIKEDPYRRALDIYFYKRKNLRIEKVDSVGQINIIPGRTSLFVVRTNPETEGLKLRKKLIYSSYPDWFKYFNFNHWIERTHLWYVYELEK